MRLVVLGGGYAGLVAARTIERHLPEQADLVVVDETGDHLIQHELHRVVRRPALSAHLTVPLASVLNRADVITERVESVDPGLRTVSLANGETLEYDAAAVCLGAETADYDRPGIDTYGQPLKRLSDAHAIREQFESLVGDGGANIVVGGAGLSGIQVAGELAALVDRESLAGAIEITLVEMAETVAPGFPSRLQETLVQELQKSSVSLRLNTTIQRASEESVETASGGELPADQFIWTGGIKGSRALGGTRPDVRSDLALAEHTFVAGDAAQVIDGDGQPVPATAQAAVAAGEVCGRNVLRSVGRGPDRPARFTFDSLGWLVSVGDEAVAQVGPSVFTGPAARTLKASAGLRYLAEVGAIREALRVISAELYE
jgi:NADH dehydrogenase